MNLISALLFSVLVSTVYSKWLKDFISLGKVEMGDGLILQMHDTLRKNASLMERHAVKLDYAGYGLSVGKAPQKDAVEIGIYVNDVAEGRGRKSGASTAIMMLMGYKMATVAAAFLSIIGALVLKALGVAKVALVTTLILLVSKLFQHHPHYIRAPTYVQVEAASSEFHPEVVEYSAISDDPHASESNNYYSYHNFAPGDEMGYTAGNVSLVNVQQAAGVLRRRDGQKKGSANQTPLVTIRRYTIAS